MKRSIAELQALVDEKSSGELSQREINRVTGHHKVSIAKTGVTRSPEVKATLSVAFKGRKLSEEHKAKLKALPKHSHTAEAKIKIGKAHKGKKMSQAALLKMKQSLTGRKLSAEHKAKIKLKSTGRTIPRESIEKRAKALVVKTNKRIADRAAEIISAIKRHGLLDDAAKELGLDRRTLFRYRKRIEAQGLLAPELGNLRKQPTKAAIARRRKQPTKAAIARRTK